jgi:hypothetical protein
MRRRGINEKMWNSRASRSVKKKAEDNEKQKEYRDRKRKQRSDAKKRDQQKGHAAKEPAKRQKRR